MCFSRPARTAFVVSFVLMLLTVASGAPALGQEAIGIRNDRGFAPGAANSALLAGRWHTGSDTALALLPVLDDAGQPIPESLIRLKMRRSGARWWLQPPAFLAGALVAYLIVPSGPNADYCSQYDPCSDREKFYATTSPWVGGAVGLLLFNAAFPGVNRIQAVERIRTERRTRNRTTVMPAGLEKTNEAEARSQR